MPFNLLILACFIYVLLLFMVAFWVERRAVIGQAEWLKSPLVYTLSLSIYCTAWTFYGAVGYASRSGLEFLTIYLGPTLVFVGWLWLLRKLVRIGRLQGVTSIADLISSRFGKSNLLGVIVTLICVVAATPYIALQLQSVTLSFSVLAGTLTKGWEQPDTASIAFWVAVGLAVFTVLFGTRNLDAKEQHPGIVTAIAVEAIVKLIALLAVGIFVVWGMAGGPMDVFERLQRADIAGWEIKPSRWAGLTFLAAAAVITLPRMFQVMVVENDNEKHLATASWAFPLYLMLMSLFVMPIAVMGLDMMPAHANPDLFVLTLPLSQGQNALAMLAFLGGFSSATSMVIVASIALATMVSNHIVMPIWLRLRSSTSQNTDLRGSILLARRCSIAAILALGYGYYELSGGSSALAAIGLISFMGVAQILPSLLGGIFWRGATKLGAALGLSIGIVIWAYTLFLPSFGPDEALSAAIMFNGPFGLYWLRPQTLFGITGLDPLMHSLFWSFFFNITAFFLGSLLSFPNPVERLQSVAFVNVFEEDVPNPSRWAQSLGEPESL
ncbi:MAG: sodium:solute symporter, partial [Paracoccaceae bacterium]|nr:sodium:solute symporter [Paracoccaceae bacterium]